MGGLTELIDAAVREALLFAGVGILLGGIDDLLVDLIFVVGRVCERLRGHRRPCVNELPASDRPGRYAIFVPAWDEAEVIGPMLRSTLARLRGPSFQLWVGCYPNDPATIAAVEAVAAEDARVRLVIGANGIM